MSGDPENKEKGFNDDELQDIMSEIENLEKEFVENNAPKSESDVEETEETVAENEETVSESEDGMTADDFAAEMAAIEGSDNPGNSAKDDSQEKIDGNYNEEEEPMMERAPSNDPSEPASEKGENDNVVELPQPSGNEINFSGSGHLDLKLSFNVGGDIAQLTVKKDGSLHIKTANADLSLSEDGCNIEMPGGARFNFPFSDVKKAG